MITDVTTDSAAAPAPPAVAIGVHGLGKRFEIYTQPRDRLLQSIFRGRRQFFKEFLGAFRRFVQRSARRDRRHRRSQRLGG